MPMSPMQEFVVKTLFDESMTTDFDQLQLSPTTPLPRKPNKEFERQAALNVWLSFIRKTPLWGELMRFVGAVQQEDAMRQQQMQPPPTNALNGQMPQGMGRPPMPPPIHREPPRAKMPTPNEPLSALSESSKE